MKRISALLVALLSVSCSTSINEYTDQKPKLNFEKFFNGKMVAHGFFKDRFGKVKKTFVVDMQTTWDNGIGTLNEDFIYNDGTKSKRIWKLKKLSENKYVGTADDVIGEAIGEIAGNALRWNYDLNLDVDGKIIKVHFDDWMYLIDESNMLNQSYMSKFNVDLGEVVLNIRKLP